MTDTHEQSEWMAPEREAAPTQAAPRPRAGNRAAHALETAKSRLMVTMAIFGLAFGAVGIKLVDATVMSQGGETGLAQAAPPTPFPPAGRTSWTVTAFCWQARWRPRRCMPIPS